MGILLAFIVFCPHLFAAENSNKAPEVIAVQARAAPLIDDLTVQVGYLPLDSFNRYLAYGGSYTHYFNGYEGWEILNVNKAINYDTGLEGHLQQSFLVSTEPFNTLDYFITSNFVYTPLFNKSLFMENNIVRGETALVAGGGMAKFDNGFVNEIDMGAIFRFFIGTNTSLKLDARYHFYFSPNVTNNLQVTAGLSYSFGQAEALEKEKAREVELED